MFKRYFYPKIGQSIILLLISIALQMITGIAVGIIFYTRLDSPVMSILMLLASALSTALTAFFGVYRSKTSLRKFFVRTNSERRSLVLSGLFFLGAYFAVLILGGILETFIPSDPELDKAFAEGFNHWAGILSIVVLAPLFEEILFRGVILRGFLKNYSPTKAIVISAVLFGVLHLNPIQSITAGILGLVLGYIFVKTGSLWAAIFFHALNNGLSTAFYHLMNNNESAELVFLVILLPAIIIGAAAFFYLRRMPDRISHILKERDEALEGYNSEQSVKEMAVSLDTAPIPYKHSGLGVASFIISMVNGVFGAATFIMLTVFTIVSMELNLEVAGAIWLVGMSFGALLSIVGLGLGIAGMVGKGKKKVFPILGTIFNSLFILVFIVFLGYAIFSAMPSPAEGFV